MSVDTLWDEESEIFLQKELMSTDSSNIMFREYLHKTAKNVKIYEIYNNFLNYLTFSICIFTT